MKQVDPFGAANVCAGTPNVDMMKSPPALTSVALHCAFESWLFVWLPISWPSAIAVFQMAFCACDRPVHRKNVYWPPAACSIE